MVLKKIARSKECLVGRHLRNPNAAHQRLVEASENLFSAFERVRNARSKVESKAALRDALDASFESVMARHRLRQLAVMDAKFPIENDAAFNERVFDFFRKNSSQRKNFSFAIVDLDFLRKLNRRKGGYAVGDAGLLAVANAVVAIAKKHNGFAGKFGGDEFKVLIPRKSSVLVSELRKALEKVCAKGFSFSAGIVEASTKTQSVRELRERIDLLANIALKESKRKGRAEITVYVKK